MKIKIEIDCEDDLSALKTFLSVTREKTVSIYKNIEALKNTDTIHPYSSEESTYLGGYKVEISK